MALANSRVQYFLPEQLEHLNKFYATVKQGDVIHTNAKGEKYRVLRYWLPIGFKTELTVTFPRHDGSYDFHTPLAMLETKDGKLIVEVPDTHACAEMTSTEWLKWLGKSSTTEQIPDAPIDPQILAQAASVPQLAEQYKADYEDLTKKGWVSGSDRKKNKK